MDSDDYAAEIAAEFPGWEAWQGIDQLWHARVRGATPPVMVHGEDLVDLRDQVRRDLLTLVVPIRHHSLGADGSVLLDVDHGRKNRPVPRWRASMTVSIHSAAIPLPIPL